jgi:hypothetical protein
MEASTKRFAAGPKELHVQLAANQDFEEMVKVLREVLTIRKFPGFAGCEPCRSGIDKLVLQSKILQQ